ncbi:MAG: LacI family DNA-binding transcriptional regulator [Steroidobacteraceae bacterium]
MKTTKQAGASRDAAGRARRRETRAQTIDDVAARAGVSIKTVSRVINHERNVREETARRVMQAIRELNYRPNLAARNLASPQAYLINVLYDNPSDNYMVSVLNGVLSACELAHYGVMLTPFDVGNPRLIDRVHEAVAQRRASGLVLTPPLCDHEPLLRALAAEGIDYVSIAPRDENREIPFVAIDDRRAARDLTDYLLCRGHRRIGFIKGHPLHGAAARRLPGYQDAHAEHGIAVDERLIASGLFSFESGVESGRRLLHLRERPTAIFAANDDMAAGVLHAAHEMGLEVPAQLSVAGFDDTPIARYVYPSLTTVRQPIRAMAQGAIECLIRSMRRRSGLKAEGPLVQRFEYELVIRNSVAQLPPGS